MRVGAECSLEERLQAITAAARNLKENIIEQSRVVESMAALEQKDQSRNRRSQVSCRGEQHEESWHKRSRARLPAHIPAEPTAFGMHDLSDVSGLQSNASQAAKARDKIEAARKIQAAYSGQVVHKSLHWALPSGGTQKDTRQGARKVGNGGKEVEDDGTGTDDSLMPTDQSSIVEVEKNTISAALTQGTSANDCIGTNPVIVAPCPPREGVPSVPSEPWIKNGGDRHSIVNMFAQPHQNRNFGGNSGGHGEDLNANACSVNGRPFITPESFLGEGSVPVISASSSSVLQGPVHSTELASSSSGSLSAVSSTCVNEAVGGMPFDHSSGRTSLLEVDEFLENSQNSVLSMHNTAGSRSVEKMVARSEWEREQRLCEVDEESQERASKDHEAETWRIRENMEAKLSEQNGKIAMVLEGSNKVMVENASRLLDVRSSRTAGTGSGTSQEPKISVDVVRGMAESAASAAVGESVKGVLSGMIPCSSASRPSMPEVKLVCPNSSTPLSKTTTVTSMTAGEISEQLEKGSSPVIMEPSEIEEDMDGEVSSGCGMEKSEVLENHDEMTGVEDTDVKKEQKDDGSGLSPTRSRNVVYVTDVSGGTRTNEEGLEEVRWIVGVLAM